MITTNYIEKLIASEHEIERYLNMIKEYSNEVYEHSINVAELSLGMAFIDGMEDTELKEFITGALLHDIGKIAIPKTVLFKRDELKEEDWKIIQSHPEEGVKIVGDKFGRICYNTICFHHENLNGTGYPFRNKEIPNYIQIIGVADRYEAMTRKRSYKKSFNHASTLAHLYEACSKGEINMKYVNMLTKAFELENSGWCNLVDYFRDNKKKEGFFCESIEKNRNIIEIVS